MYVAETLKPYANLWRNLRDIDLYMKFCAISYTLRAVLIWISKTAPTELTSLREFRGNPDIYKIKTIATGILYLYSPTVAIIWGSLPNNLYIVLGRLEKKLK